MVWIKAFIFKVIFYSLNFQSFYFAYDYEPTNEDNV